MAEPTGTPIYYCPRCATPAGSARFCATCGLDFSTYTPTAQAPVPAAPQPPAWQQPPAPYGAPPYGTPPYGGAAYGQAPFGAQPPQYPGQYPSPYGAPYGGYAAPAQKPSLSIGGVGMIAGAIAIFVGSFLPWASMSYLGTSLTINGTEGGRDGTITLGIAVILGLIAVVAVLQPNLRKIACVGGLVLALAAGGIAGADISDISKAGGGSYSSIDFSFTVGIGLWTIAAGAVVAGVSSLVGLAGR